MAHSPRLLRKYPKEFLDIWESLGEDWQAASAPKPSFEKWKKLTNYERAEAMKGIPLNIAFMKEEHKNFPTRRYCSFVVWLNQERWDGLIDAEEKRQAQIEQAKAHSAARAKEEQTVMTLVVPIDERKAKVASAHAALIQQQKAKIKPILEECQRLEKESKNATARRKWAALRADIPYLPEEWRDVCLA